MIMNEKKIDNCVDAWVNRCHAIEDDEEYYEFENLHEKLFEQLTDEEKLQVTIELESVGY